MKSKHSNVCVWLLGIRVKRVKVVDADRSASRVEIRDRRRKLSRQERIYKWSPPSVVCKK